MAEHSAIEWTDTTWNPVTGCDRVSPGCAHCYALDLAARLKRMGQAKYQRDGDPKSSGPGFGVTLHPAELQRPRRWRRARRVFVNSMSDLFHDEIPDQFIAEVFAVMAECPQHTFQVLTKRPDRMASLLSSDAFWLAVSGEVASRSDAVPAPTLPDPLPNVWLGVSVENRQWAERADVLRRTPAAVRFISAEPLLGPLLPTAPAYADFKATWILPGGRVQESDAPALSLDGIDWLIVGGESGSGHRPIEVEWVRDLRDACLAQRLGPDGHDDARLGTRFFFKQWGGAKPTSGGRDLDGRTWDEFPATAEVPAR